MQIKTNLIGKNIKVFLFCIGLFFFSLSQDLANAATNKIPAPTIGTLLGFFPNGKYTAISSGGNSSLEAGETIVSYDLTVVYLDAGQQVNAPCGTADNGTVIASVRKESTPQNSTQFLPLLATWNNPANSEFRIICAFSSYQIKNAAGAVSYLKSPISYVTILPVPSPSASPSSTVVSEIVAPSGTKPSVSGTPVAGTKFKVSVKSWNMNGNKFEGRSVYLKLCDDSECKDVINSYPIIETGTLNFDVAKTLTMPKVVGKEGQYIQVIDSVSYPAPATSESGEDQLVELSSSIKKIESETVTSASPSSMSTASATATAIATEEAVAQEPDINATEIIQDSKSSSLNMIILIFGIVIAILLIVLLTILMKRKK